MKGAIILYGQPLCETRRENIIQDKVNNHGWSMLQYLRTRDFHEIEYTKRIEINLIKAFLRTPDITKWGDC